MGKTRLRLFWGSALAVVAIGIAVPLAIWAATIGVSDTCNNVVGPPDAVNCEFGPGSTGDVATLRETVGIGFPEAESATLTESIQKASGFSRADSASVEESGQIFAIGTLLQRGWSSFSIPISARNNKFLATPATVGTSAQDGLVDPSKVEIAFKFDAAATPPSWKLIVTTVTDPATQIANTDRIRPTEGVVVKSSESHRATLIFNTLQTSPPSRTLKVGWNLVGLAAPLGRVEMAVNEALITVEVAPNSKVGYDLVVNVSMDRLLIFTRGMPVEGIPPFRRWRACWVFMENEDTLGGFSSTPIQ